MRNYPFPIILFLVSLLSEEVRAQTNTRRLVAPSARSVTAGAMISLDNVLSIRSFDSDGGVSSVPLDLTLSGAISFLVNGDICVVGQHEDEGRVILVRKVAESYPSDIYQVMDTSDIPDADILGVAFAPELGKLYLLDVQNKRVLMGNYPIGADVLPDTWTVLLDEHDTVALASPEHFLLGADAEAGILTLSIVPTLQSSGIELSAEGDGSPVGLDSYTLQVFAPGIALTITNKGLWRHGILESELVLGATSIPVNGPANVGLHLMEMTDTTTLDIGSTVTDSEGVGTIILPFDSEINLGKIYGLKSNSFGSLAPPYTTPIIRLGVAESLDQGRVIRSLDARVGMTLYSNNSLFEMPLVIDHTIPASEVIPSQYLAALAVGTAADVTSSQGRLFLNVPELLLSTARVWSAEEEGFATRGFPVSNDPELVGTVIYFQWIVLAPDVRLSDIIGVVVRSQKWSGATGDVGRASASLEESSLNSQEFTIKQEFDASALRALKQWKRACGFKASSLLTDLKRKG